MRARDWKEFALRKARREFPCYVCGGEIAPGQQYRDGGAGRRAHAACAEKNPTTELPHDIWKDPDVMSALKDGRSAEDIAVLACPKCHEWGYYNEGSHFYCRFCQRGWSCIVEGEPTPGIPFIRLDEEGHTSLADTVTVCEEGCYDNRTLPY